MNVLLLLGYGFLDGGFYRDNLSLEVLLRVIKGERERRVAGIRGCNSVYAFGLLEGADDYVGYWGHDDFNTHLDSPLNEEHRHYGAEWNREEEYAENEDQAVEELSDDCGTDCANPEVLMIRIPLDHPHLDLGHEDIVSEGADDICQDAEEDYARYETKDYVEGLLTISEERGYRKGAGKPEHQEHDDVCESPEPDDAS